MTGNCTQGGGKTREEKPDKHERGSNFKNRESEYMKKNETNMKGRVDNQI